MVLVEWEDAITLDAETWIANEPMTKTTPCMVYTVGFLVHEEPGRLVLVESWNPEITGPRTQIPRGMVRSVQQLRARKG